MADIFDLFKKIGATRTDVGSKPGYLVVGLGNPGSKYEGTRHNAGFEALDFVTGKFAVKVLNSKFKALTGVGTVGGKGVMFMKPQTFMNLSGDSVSEAVRFYKIPVENVIVISDDICQEPGRIRIRKNGSAGGHNGLSDIITKLGGDGFTRIRIGVGAKPDPEYDLADWVLGKVPPDAEKQIRERYDDICETVRMIIDGKTDEAMGLFNGKRNNI